MHCSLAQTACAHKRTQNQKICQKIQVFHEMIWSNKNYEIKYIMFFRHLFPRWNVQRM